MNTGYSKSGLYLGNMHVTDILKGKTPPCINAGKELAIFPKRLVCGFHIVLEMKPKQTERI